MNNNTYSNKYKSKQVSMVCIRYLDGNVSTMDANENTTIYLKENKDNLYISTRRSREDGTTVTEHAKVFKNAIACFIYSELPYVESEKKEEENEEF